MADLKMPFMEHLVELRTRLMRMVVAVVIGFLISFWFSEYLLRFIKRPLATELVFLAPAEAFFVNVKLGFFAGIILAIPVILLECWRFVAPGLLEREKQLTLPFVVSATFLFLLGAAFCYVIVLPFGIQYLLSYATPDLRPMISVGNYVSFATRFMLAFGAVFEVPLVMVFLTLLGVVTPAFLARNRKYAILMTFIVAAIATPGPDVASQILLGVPMLGLYELSIFASRFVERRKKASEEAASADEQEEASGKA
ncbi:MAG: twin-arginine translocase subunit TatC [Candidatus Tectomicrobia bacterium]|nr:twin-arginine translocase subunit TatC [Candidatus Tectomicrobia bacterium]